MTGRKINISIWQIRPMILGLGLFSLGICLMLAFAFQQPRIDFNADIRPILNSKCLSCHGGVKKQGGFSLLFRDEALGITDSGEPAILPGDPENSEFIRRLTHPDPELRMPYEGEALSKAEVKLLKQWVSQGAKWSMPWAFIAPKTDIVVPKADKDWVQNEIDPFIWEKMKERALSPSPEADKASLLRRLSLDLIGLPPRPEEIRRFLANDSLHAYEQEVDRLLASPQFGEKWASYWLDLARYADSKGYEKDLNRSIWLYRDWVIEAFNQDLPFDEFTLHQLAGDLLPNPSQSQLIATGFHRNTMANDEGGTNDEEYRVAAMVERIGTTYEVWQGLTMACVQCHSHPYDPIRHEDFYTSYAIFNNTADTDLYNEQPKSFVFADSNEVKVKELMLWVQNRFGEESPELVDTFLQPQMHAFLNQLGYRRVEAEEYQAASRLVELTADQLVISQIQDSSWIMYRDIDLEGVEAIRFRWSSVLSGGFVEIRRDSLDGTMLGRTLLGKSGGWNTWREKNVKISSSRGKHDLYYRFFRNQDRAQELFRLDELAYISSKARWKKYGGEMEAKLKALWEMPAYSSPIFQELTGEDRRESFVFERGNWLSPGKKVIPAPPASLPQGNSPEIWDRLQFARWLLSPENPLTARVAVNRFWEQLFGRGLVATVEDLGSQGSKPSHPELLDYLAIKFQGEMNWSMKALIKEMVMSSTYRQSTRVGELQLRKDPLNMYLSRAPRLRLTAEQLRDQTLFISDVLDLKQGGKPVRLGLSPAKDPFGQEKLIDLEPFRRAVYSYRRRTTPIAMLTTFDSPDRNVCTSRRVRTNTPLQALVTLNDPVLFQAARQLAWNLMSGKDQDMSKLIAQGYFTMLGKAISEDKKQVLLKLAVESEAYFRRNPEEACLLFEEELEMDSSPQLAALTLTLNSMMNLDELLNR